MFYLFLGIIFSINIHIIYGGFSFRPEDPDIFLPCTREAEVKSLTEYVNFTDMNFSYEEDYIHVSGDIEIFGDIQSTDNIAVEAKMLKYVRNTWQPTPIFFVINDFCKAMYEANNFVHDAWGKFISDTGKNCPAKGVKYHHEPFAAKLEYSGSFKWSGPHKFVILFVISDKDNEKKDVVICTEIPGEMFGF